MQANAQMLKNMIGLGLAGNFANHLEQAGEAKDFACIICDDENAPKGMFPFYVPQDSGILGRFCFNDEAIILPQDSTLCIQAEPEVALECEIIYEGDSSKVIAVEPRFFMACNDTSVRNDPNATKLSQKKNFSLGSKGLGRKLSIDNFTKSGVCQQYSLASFIRKQGAELEPYGECSTLCSYSYFYRTLTDWIACKLNTQKDLSVLENLQDILARSHYPRQAIISVGATRYMPQYENYFLQENDEIAIVVFNHNTHTYEQIQALVASKSLDPHISALYQRVQRHA